MSVRMAITAFALGVVVASGCRRPPPAPLPEPDQSYQLRGQIVRLPASDRGEMYVEHEAIPQFVGANGQVVGMKAMTMPFAVASEAEVESLAIGDKIEFTFEVRWQREPRSLLRNVRVLPKETPLELPSSSTE